jgi:hypothetical protein
LIVVRRSSNRNKREKRWRQATYTQGERMFPNNNLRDQFHGRRWHLPTPIGSVAVKVGGEMIELWVPPPIIGVSHYGDGDVRPFFVGPDWSSEGVDTWDDPETEEVLFELCEQSGLLWSTESGTPLENELKELNSLRCETDLKIEKGRADQNWVCVDGSKECRLNLGEYEEGLEKWREEGEIMDCLDESRFVDYDQGTGESFYVRNSDGKISVLTPEQLDQRIQLNIRFNLGFKEADWLHSNHYYFDQLANKGCSRQGVGGVIESQQVPLEIVCTGKDFSVAKWECGGVYIPKASSIYLRDMTEEGWCNPGKKFLGNISWVNSKYPWRLDVRGVVGRIDDQHFTYDS